MHRGCRIKYSALDLVDLYRLNLPKDGICVERSTAVPAVFQRLARFAPGLDGDMETTRLHVAVQSARS